MKKYLTFLFLLPVVALLYFYSQIYSPVHTFPKLEFKTTEDTLSLLFIGDIMGHQAQINAAFDKKSKTYKYETTFEKVSDIIKSYDFSLANLEVTVGPPYSGYPNFASPKSLVVAAKNAGIDVCFTANNHACDKGVKGIKHTLKVLDTLKMKHTGTFATKLHRDKDNLIILEKDSLRVGLLNYTEHTNWVPTPKGVFVNRMQVSKMITDIKKAGLKKLDKLVLMVHWGDEYKHFPQNKQIDLAKKLFTAGVDIIIGSHPHVLQPMHYCKATKKSKEKLIYYSLGNFVSDQRRRYRDGGGLAGIVIAKKEGKSYIKKHGYHLVWVNKHKKKGDNIFEVLPVRTYENNKSYLKGYAKKRMEEFISDSRKLLGKYNTNVSEW